MNEVKRQITLIDGSVIVTNHDSMECPVCLNGAMTLKSIDGDKITYYCDKCQAELVFPYKDCKTAVFDEEIIDEGDYGIQINK